MGSKPTGYSASRISEFIKSLRMMFLKKLFKKNKKQKELTYYLGNLNDKIPDPLEFEEMWNLDDIPPWITDMMDKSRWNIKDICKAYFNAGRVYQFDQNKDVIPLSVRVRWDQNL